MIKKIIRSETFGWLLILSILAVIVLMMPSCNGCNKQPVPVVPLPETITNNAKPVDDSLRKEIAVLKDSVSLLKIIAAKASIKKEVIRERVIDRPVPVTDSGALLAYNDLKNDFDLYVAQSDQQAAAQGEIIVKQEKVITKQISDIALQESKFKELATAFTNLNGQYEQAIKDLKKSDKKNGVLKFFVKVLGITSAAMAAVLAIVFL